METHKTAPSNSNADGYLFLPHAYPGKMHGAYSLDNLYACIYMLWILYAKHGFYNLCKTCVKFVYNLCMTCV